MHAQAKPETTEPSIIEHTRRPARTATRGFSLLEVTLVLVIIGLLIGGAAVAFGPALLRAQERTTKNDMATIKRAIQEYQLQNRSILPQSLADLVPGFLEDVVTDGWGLDFYYAAGDATSLQPYVLISAGKDGQFETEDDISVWDVDE